MDDLLLAMTSPCLDAGDNLGVPEDILDVYDDGQMTGPVPIDQDTAARISDSPAADTGNPDGVHPIVYMGAFEFALDVPTLPGDMNCDGTVDGLDIGAFMLALLDPTSYVATYPGCNSANGDLNDSGALDEGDIAGLIALLIDHSTIPSPGDMNCDGAVNGDDITGFALAVLDPAGYESTNGKCRRLNADDDGNGAAATDNLPSFVDLLLD